MTADHAPHDLCSLIREPTERAPDRPALVFPTRTLSFGALSARIDNCAGRLWELGVRPEARIALLDTCSELFVCSLFGAARIGAAVVPMHVELKPEEIRDVASHAACTRYGIAGETYAESLRRGLGAPIWGRAELFEEKAAQSAPQMDIDPELPCVVLLTSGTTGLPKPIPITHRVLTPRMATFAGNFDPTKPPARSLLCLPGNHIGGLGGLLVSLAGGNTVVVMPRFRAGEWLESVARHRITTTFIVPTMIRRILDHQDFDKTDLSSLRVLSYGAAAAPAATVEEMIRRFPDTLMFANVYGQTETTGGIATFGPSDHRLDEAGHLIRAGSVGRLNPGVEYRLVDPESGTDVSQSESGELWVRSAATAAAGWNKTGDLMRIDEEGYLYPVDRLSDTINRGGEKFGPSEIEEILRCHPSIIDAAVAGIPDPELGERVGAAIVRFGRLRREAVRDHCLSHLARFKVPVDIAFVDAIPLSGVGKIRRREIRELIQKRSSETKTAPS